MMIIGTTIGIIGIIIFVISFILWIKSITNKNMGKMFLWLIFINIGNLLIHLANFIVHINKIN